MSPVRNADKMAKSGLVLTYRCTMSAIMAVGPMAGGVCVQCRERKTYMSMWRRREGKESFQGFPSRLPIVMSLQLPKSK